MKEDIEEEKAINNMKMFARVHQDMTIVTAEDMDIVLNLIEKLQKENEELKHKYDVFVQISSDVIENSILKPKIKDKIEELKELNIKDNKSVKRFEEMRRNTDSDFYKKSYQTSIHKLNAQIENRNHIISELQELLKEK